MTNNIAKCGCDCSNCPTYSDNIRTMEGRQNCSTGWAKYLNIKLSPEKLRACDGCSVPDNKRKTFYLNCKIRKCAIINEIENCAFCSGFPCYELLNVHSIQTISNRQDFMDRTGKEISDDDFNRFIEPYAGLGHLNKIRQSLLPNDLKDYKKYSSNMKFAHIDNLSEQPKSVQIIYALLTNICISQNISFARLQALEKKREQLIKIIWTLGYFGNFTDDKTLEVGSNIFMSQKINGMYNTLTGYLNDLKAYDIHCEIIPLIDKGWLTPMGGLRKEGWKIILRFGESLNGADTLRALKDFVVKLSENFDNNAFKMFNKADVNIMIASRI